MSTCSHEFLFPIPAIPDKIKSASLRVTWIPGSHATCAECGLELALVWVPIGAEAEVVATRTPKTPWFEVGLQVLEAAREERQLVLSAPDVE